MSTRSLGLAPTFSVKERRAQYEEQAQTTTTSPRDSFRRAYTEEPSSPRRDEASKFGTSGKASALINQFKTIEAEATAAENLKLQQRPPQRKRDDDGASPRNDLRRTLSGGDRPSPRDIYLASTSPPVSPRKTSTESNPSSIQIQIPNTRIFKKPGEPSGPISPRSNGTVSIPTRNLEVGPASPRSPRDVPVITSFRSFQRPVNPNPSDQSPVEEMRVRTFTRPSQPPVARPQEDICNSGDSPPIRTSSSPYRPFGRVTDETSGDSPPVTKNFVRQPTENNNQMPTRTFNRQPTAVNPENEVPPVQTQTRTFTRNPPIQDPSVNTAVSPQTRTFVRQPPTTAQTEEVTPINPPVRSFTRSFTTQEQTTTQLEGTPTKVRTFTKPQTALNRPSNTGDINFSPPTRVFTKQPAPATEDPPVQSNRTFTKPLVRKQTTDIPDISPPVRKFTRPALHQQPQVNPPVENTNSPPRQFKKEIGEQQSKQRSGSIDVIKPNELPTREFKRNQTMHETPESNPQRKQSKTIRPTLLSHSKKNSGAASSDPTPTTSSQESVEPAADRKTLDRTHSINPDLSSRDFKRRKDSKSRETVLIEPEQIGVVIRDFKRSKTEVLPEEELVVSRAFKRGGNQEPKPRESLLLIHPERMVNRSFKRMTEQQTEEIKEEPAPAPVRQFKRVKSEDSMNRRSKIIQLEQLQAREFKKVKDSADDLQIPKRTFTRSQTEASIPPKSSSVQPTQQVESAKTDPAKAAAVAAKPEETVTVMTAKYDYVHPEKNAFFLNFKKGDQFFAILPLKEQQGWIKVKALKGLEQGFVPRKFVEEGNGEELLSVLQSYALRQSILQTREAPSATDQFTAAIKHTTRKLSNASPPATRKEDQSAVPPVRTFHRQQTEPTKIKISEKVPTKAEPTAQQPPNAVQNTGSPTPVQPQLTKAQSSPQMDHSKIQSTGTSANVRSTEIKPTPTQNQTQPTVSPVNTPEKAVVEKQPTPSPEKTAVVVEQTAVVEKQPTPSPEKTAVVVEKQPTSEKTAVVVEKLPLDLTPKVSPEIKKVTAAGKSPRKISKPLISKNVNIPSKGDEDVFRLSEMDPIQASIEDLKNLLTTNEESDLKTIKYSDDDSVSGGSLQGLLRIFGSVDDFDFTTSFLMIYPYFIRSEAVMKFFIMLFRADFIPQNFQPVDLSPAEKKSLQRDRIISSIDSWLAIQADYLNGDLAWLDSFSRFADFLNDTDDSKLRDYALRLSTTWRAVRQRVSKLRGLNFKIPPNANTVDLLTLEPNEIATQLTIFEHSCFQRIPLYEYFASQWKDSPLKAKNLCLYLKRFDELVLWVITTILEQEDKADCIGMWVAVLDELLQLNNFSTLSQIYDAVSSPVIEKYLEDIDFTEDEVQVLNEVAELLSPENNFAAYRQKLDEIEDAPCLPILSITMEDLTTFEAYPTFTSPKVINFEKMSFLSTVYEQVQDFHSREFTLDTNQEIQDFLHNVSFYPLDILLATKDAFSKPLNIQMKRKLSCCPHFEDISSDPHVFADFSKFLASQATSAIVTNYMDAWTQLTAFKKVPDSIQRIQRGNEILKTFFDPKSPRFLGPLYKSQLTLNQEIPKKHFDKAIQNLAKQLDTFWVTYWSQTETATFNPIPLIESNSESTKESHKNKK